MLYENTNYWEHQTDTCNASFTTNSNAIFTGEIFNMRTYLSNVGYRLKSKLILRDLFASALTLKVC